ncbi:hypothetical protein E4T42_03004 [Aureobasidium subglaciale]|nr:hypothetical protein E4T42_03004 [Aureobasidium subglaciale]
MFIPFPNPMIFFKFCRGSNDESTSKPSSKVYKPRKRSIKAGDSKRTKPAKPANRAATSSRLSTPAKVPSESSEPQLQPTKSTGKTIDDDAELRAKLQNASKNVPKYLFRMCQVFGDEFGPSFHEEYLVHGVVKGQHYMAVPLNELCNRGLLEQLPGVIMSYNREIPYPGSTFGLPWSPRPFAINDLVQLKSIASLYGPRFSTPFAITLFCCKKHPQFWKNLTTSELRQIVQILGGPSKTLREWGQSYSILNQSVYPKGFQVSEQMFHVMRALAIHCSKESNEQDIVSRLSTISVSASDSLESTAKDCSAATRGSSLVLTDVSKRRAQISSCDDNDQELMKASQSAKPHTPPYSALAAAQSSRRRYQPSSIPPLSDVAMSKLGMRTYDVHPSSLSSPWSFCSGMDAVASFSVAVSAH